MPSAVTLTPEQSKAINTRDASIALSAGAGCGKTFVLTERFLSHLHHDHGEPARLGQLIAITFTDAAAREMRTRIRNACYDRLQQSTTPDEELHWLTLLREIDAARISTIHAFCTSLLRNHATAAGLDPTFGVLDQSDADVLQYDVIDDVLREKLDKLDEDTLNLATAYDLRRVKEQLAELLSRRHDDAFEQWLAATPEDVVAAWRSWHADVAIPTSVAEIATTAPIGEIIELLQSVEPSKPIFADARAMLLELLPKLKAAKATSEEINQICEYARVKSVAGPFICTAKDWPDKDAYGQYSKTCELLRKTVDKLQPPEWNDEAALETARLGLALLKLTASVADEYEQRKRVQGKLDFDDLLHRAYRLISDPNNDALRDELADDLRLLLVDEFQDTDQLQVDLVLALCGAGFDAGRLFFVGDFKQSIYRFRGAEPKVFQELRNKIQQIGRLPLSTNFRSQPEILHFVNALFCDAFNNHGDTYEMLQPRREQATTPPAVEFLWTIAPDKNNKGIPGARQAARALEATAIARRIRAMLDDQSTELPIVDKKTGQPRRLDLGDIAILFRTLGDVQVYEEALREYGLDYYLVGGYAFYAQQEIYDVLNLLRAVASAADEVSLAGALRSPFFALADETLFWLADTAGTLNAGLLADSPPVQLSAEEAAKTTAAADTIRHLRAIKDRVPIATLLGEALDRTGYDAVLLTEFLGERKLANLHKLVERARAIDQGGVTDFDGFITQLSQFIAREPKESLAATLPEAANVIRLMTIHHAKGLEFPLVVLPDLDRQLHHGAASAVLDARLGPLVPNPADDDEKTATGMRMFAAFDRREELEERKRMLYVATTRARDYLILSSSLESCDAPKTDWMELIADRFDLSTGELRAALPAGYATPHVRVTTDPQSDFKTIGRARGADLLRMLDEARALADDGAGIIPLEVAPIPVDRTARHQFSFSRLTGQLKRTGAATPPDATAGSPSSASEATPLLDARDLGSLVHDVLQRIDFTAQNAAAEIADWCEHLAPQYVPDHTEQAVRLATKMVHEFVTSPRGQKLATATTTHREIEFLLAWPPENAFELTNEKTKKGKQRVAGVERQRAPRELAFSPRTRYIRGYIDCLYQDTAGAWRIVDYKTNDVTAAELDHITKRYEMQLYVYAMAAEQALGTSPSELVLQLLRPGIEHILPWNAEARRRAIELVTEAIETATQSLPPLASDL